MLVIPIGLMLMGLLFIVSGGNKVLPLAAGALLAVPLSIIHTPFALMVLYFLLPVEGAMVLSPYFSISKAMGIVVLLSFMFTRLRRRPDVPYPLSIILLLFAFACLSMTWSLSWRSSVTGLTTLLLNIGMMLVLLNTVHEARQFKLIMWSMLAGAFVASILIVGGYAGYAGFSRTLGRVVLSETQNPNVLGNAVVLGILAGLYIFLDSRISVKLFICAVEICLLLALLKTQSRSALGTVILAPLLAFIVCAKKGHRLKYIVGALLVCAVSLIFARIAVKSDFLSPRAKTRLLESKQDLSASGRFEQWKKGLRHISKRPLLGYGIKNYNLITGRRVGITSAHNSIIELTGELGLIGMVLAISIYVALFAYVRGSPYPYLQWLAVAFIFYSVLIGLTHTMYFFKEFWYSLSFAMLIGKISETRLSRNGCYSILETGELETGDFR